MSHLLRATHLDRPHFIRLIWCERSGATRARGTIIHRGAPTGDDMRKSFWIGLVLLVVGLIVALSGQSYNDERAGIGVGDTRVAVEDREGVPSWLGWVSAGIGLVLMINGLRGRTGPTRTFDEHRPHTP
jgi:hypothetical protein